VPSLLENPRQTGPGHGTVPDDQKFRPRLGRTRSAAPKRPKLFVAQVLTAAQASGHVAQRFPVDRPDRARGSGSGRGAVAASNAMERRLYGNRGRRVIVKARVVLRGFRGTGALRAHLNYLKREGVTRDGQAARMFDATSDEVDVKTFTERAEADPHHFRFIVSPEDAAEMEDLRAYTRDLVRQMERDLGTRLEWAALDHWNTDNPHIHLLVRGADEHGRELRIHPDYISHGMRERAAELVTIELGPQSELEIRSKLASEVGADRWTRLDVALRREAERAEGSVLDFRRDAAGASREDAALHSLLVGRLQKLERMGLARSLGPAQWRLAEEAEPTLRDLGTRGDIVRTMQHAFARSGQQLNSSAVAMPDPGQSPERPVVGRLVEKGLDDELKGSGYLIVDGVDGRSHYIRTPALEQLGDLRRNDIVRIAHAEMRPADRTIARFAAEHGGIYDPERHRVDLLRSGATEPDSVVEAHVRRLEAVRRGARAAERLSDGRWRVDADYAERAAAYDRKRGHVGDIDVRSVSQLSLDRQVTASGATWLDREAVGREKTELAGTGFGVEVRDALARRADYLVDQGLARRQGQRVVFARDLLDTLIRREVIEAAAQIAKQTGMRHHALSDGDRVSGVYRKSVDLASGRFAVVDDGKQFSLVPWRPIVERELGREVSGVVRGSGVSWDIGRGRGLGL